MPSFRTAFFRTVGEPEVASVAYAHGAAVIKMPGYPEMMDPSNALSARIGADRSDQSPQRRQQNDRMNAAAVRGWPGRFGRLTGVFTTFDPPKPDGNSVSSVAVSAH